MIQAKMPEATGLTSRLTAEKAAGNRPSAQEIMPWPMVWLTKASPPTASQPSSVCGTTLSSVSNAAGSSHKAVQALVQNITCARPTVARAAFTPRR